MANISKKLSPFDIAVRMLLVSIIFKMIVFFAAKQFTFYESIAIFINIFVLMTGVFLGIWNYRKLLNAPQSFTDYLKEGMKVAALYAILMTAFVYVYYTFIDSTYFYLKLAKQSALLEESGRATQEIKQATETMKVVLTPFFQSTITLIGFLLLGSFYASIITFLLRKFKPGF